MRSLLSRILVALELDRIALAGVAFFGCFMVGLGAPIVLGFGKISQIQQMTLSLLVPAILLVIKVFTNPVAWGNPATLKKEKEFDS